MRTTIDDAGRIVVPKALRKSARLEPGTELELRLVGDHIEIEARPAAVRLVRRGRLLVAEAVSPVKPLTRSEVDEVRESLRSERGRRR